MAIASDPRPLVSDAARPDAARSEDYLWTLNFGPQHPATHTTLRLVLKLEGERVVDALPEMGYLHSGFEKIGEHLTFNQYVTVSDRMNYISPMANNVAWHHAVEKLLGIELTPRCKYVRTIIAELARISDHLLCNGAVGLDTGAFTFFLYGFYQREVIYDIFETLCGARFTNSYTRVGGVSQDFTPLVIEKINTFLRTFPKTLDDMERLLTRNRIFVDRTKGVGVLSKADAINGGASGPVARASGVTRLLRPVSGADAGDAGEPEDPAAGARQPARWPRQRGHRPADGAADEETGLFHDRRHDLPL